ncbi:AMP-binding protein [Geodermatophilus sp. SYSU D00698]
MSLTAYLDKGASLGPDAPCLTGPDGSMSYGEVQRFSRRVAGALARSGVRPGDPVAVLSANDPTAFAAVFGIARAGAVWCPVNPRNEAAENRELLDLFGCTTLLHQRSFTPLVAAIRDRLPRLATLVCLDGDGDGGDPALQDWLTGAPEGDDTEPPGGLVVLVGTGGTTGRPKGRIISGGFNVYSAEVEQAVMAHPAVQDCAVVGVPDEKWGERVVAVVQPRAGEALDPADVRAFVRARIGGVKAPKEVLVWADLPRSTVGKVLKGDVRSRLLTAGGA